MNDVLDMVLRDLATEGDRLEGMVADLTEDAWRTPTPAAGWDVAAQVAHLAWTDEVAVFAATDKEKWDEVVMLAIGDPDGFAGAAALAGAAADPGDILGRWRTARVSLQETLRAFPPGQRLAWFGPPMSPTSMATARFMETWAHSLDVAEALGVPPEPTDRIRHVAHLGVRTRNFAFGVHGLEPPAEEFGVTLVSPSEEVVVVGSGGRRADGHRLGVRLLPAGHAAPAPGRHRPGRRRRRRRPLARHRAGVRGTAR